LFTFLQTSYRINNETKGKNMSKLLRINEHIYSILEQLEQEMGSSKQTILQDILIEYMKNRVINQINAAYFDLRQDPEKWQEELDERALWENSSSDGLEDL